MAYMTFSGYLNLMYSVGQKMTVLGVDNFEIFNGREAYNMSKVSRFCLEKA